MISFAAGRAGIVFLGGANLLLFGQSRICVFSELCGSCVGVVSYTSRAMYGCCVGALLSIEGCKGYGVSQSENNWIILVYAKK